MQYSAVLNLGDIKSILRIFDKFIIIFYLIYFL